MIEDYEYIQLNCELECLETNVRTQQAIPLRPILILSWQCELHAVPIAF